MFSFYLGLEFLGRETLVSLTLELGATGVAFLGSILGKGMVT